jgi:hypothetical protein
MVQHVLMLTTDSMSPFAGDLNVLTIKTKGWHTDTSNNIFSSCLID